MERRVRPCLPVGTTRCARVGRTRRRSRRWRWRCMPTRCTPTSRSTTSSPSCPTRDVLDGARGSATASPGPSDPSTAEWDDRPARRASSLWRNDAGPELDERREPQELATADGAHASASTPRSAAWSPPRPRSRPRTRAGRRRHHPPRPRAGFHALNVILHALAVLLSHRLLLRPPRRSSRTATPTRAEPSRGSPPRSSPRTPYGPRRWRASSGERTSPPPRSPPSRSSRTPTGNRGSPPPLRVPRRCVRRRVSPSSPRSPRGTSRTPRDPTEGARERETPREAGETAARRRPFARHRPPSPLPLWESSPVWRPPRSPSGYTWRRVARRRARRRWFASTARWRTRWRFPTTRIRVRSLAHLHATYAYTATAWPARLSCDWSHACVEPITSAYDARALLAAAAYAASATALIRGAVAPPGPAGSPAARARGLDRQRRAARPRVQRLLLRRHVRRRAASLRSGARRVRPPRRGRHPNRHGRHALWNSRVERVERVGLFPVRTPRVQVASRAVARGGVRVVGSRGVDVRVRSRVRSKRRVVHGRFALRRRRARMSSKRQGTT